MEEMKQKFVHRNLRGNFKKINIIREKYEKKNLLLKIDLHLAIELCFVNYNIKQNK